MERVFSEPGSDGATPVTPERAAPAPCDPPHALSILAETFHWRIPSKPELIEKVVMSLKDRAEAWGLCNPDRVTGLVISLTEAITNAMVHGNLEISSDIRERTDGEYGRLLARRCADPAFADREVQIDVHWDGRTCVWTIADHGNGFDVDRVLARLESNEVSELASGRGILLMRAFMDDVRWSAGGREIRLAMARDGQADVGVAQRIRLRHAVKAKGFHADTAAPADAIATRASPAGMDLLANGLTQAKRLLLEVEIDGQKALIPAEVRHVTQLAADWVQIDCRFAIDSCTTSSADAEAQRAAIERVLQSANRAADAGHERRTTMRYQYNEVVRIERRDGTLFHGVARDLSRGGMAFIGNFQLERGETLTLTLEPETALPVKVICEVMRAQQLAGVYHDFGVRFLAN